MLHDQKNLEDQQGSFLSYRWFAVVMDNITKDVRESGVKELLYTDDLVLLGKSRKKPKKVFVVENNVAQLLKKTATENGLKVNVTTTKAFRTGESTVAMKTSKFPCSVHKEEVGKNLLPFIN